MTYDFVVIGAGVSGMTTALVLARHGQRVALLEQAPHPAPLLRGFDRGGRHFETGFHYAGGLDADGILTRFFRYLGLSEGIEAVPFDGAGFDLLRRGDGSEFRFPTGYRELAVRLESCYPGERAGIGRYLRLLQENWQQLPYLNLDADFGSLGPFGILQGPSLAEVLDRTVSDPGLRQLLTLHTLLHGVPAGAIPFALHASVIGLYYRSVHGIRGGGGQVAAAFASGLERAGVSLLTGCRATGLTWTAAGNLAGVVTDSQGVLACRECVASMHPGMFLDLVGPAPLRPAYRKRLAGLEETVSAYLCFCRGDRPLPLLSGRNVYLAGRHDQPLEDLAAPPQERLLYLAGSPAASGEAPRDFVAICPARFAETAPWQESRRSRRPAGYQQFKADIMGRLQERIGVACPELRGRFTLVAGATPLTLRDYLGHPAGGLYGVGHRVGQYNPQAATRLPGVYLTGQATAAPGLLGGMLSGFLTCGEILGHDRLRGEIKQCVH